MSRFPKLAAILLICGMASPAAAESFGLGRLATPDEIAAWDIDVRPDGLGLPEGQGSVAEGEPIFSERCAVCHGDFGEAVGRWPVLAGGRDTLRSDRPVKTIGSYWPFLSTVWDYVHRAMPFGDAQSLSADETYALTAYLLYLNDIVDDEFVLTRENFTEVKMPNAGGFIPDDRMESAVWKNRDPCMSDCKPEVKITARAAVIDVTPEDPTAHHATPAEGEQKSEAAEPAKDAATEVAAAPAADPALVEAGEKVFKKCAACHAIGAGAKNKVGPELNAIIGRTAGTVDGFKYSKDMVKAGEEGLVWTRDSLAHFLAKPKDMIKRTKMSFAGLKKEAELEAVIAYLEIMGSGGTN